MSTHYQTIYEVGLDREDHDEHIEEEIEYNI